MRRMPSARCFPMAAFSKLMAIVCCKNSNWINKMISVYFKMTSIYIFKSPSWLSTVLFIDSFQHIKNTKTLTNNTIRSSRNSVNTFRKQIHRERGKNERTNFSFFRVFPMGEITSVWMCVWAVGTRWLRRCDLETWNGKFSLCELCSKCR